MLGESLLVCYVHSQTFWDRSQLNASVDEEEKEQKLPADSGRKGIPDPWRKGIAFLQ